MALKGYFIQATFEDGTEVSAYAAYDGTWYYFYTDRRFRFTLTSAGAVDIQQYQPIGSNMAWYDIDIITAVSVEQFDPDNSGGGGTVPEDVYTKDEVEQLIAAAVREVEAQIPDLVAQAVQEAIGGLDDRYVLKAGDTMTGQLKLVYGNSTMSVASTGIRVWDTTDQSKLGNATIRVNIGGGYINLFNSAHDYQATVNANNKIVFLARYNSETNGYTYESRMANDFWMLNDIDNGTQPVYLGYNINGSFLYIRDPDNSCYTYISNDDMQMKVGSSNRVWIRNTADEGAFIAYDDAGNNTWYQPTQISAWTNGGTSQSLITPGADAISFNKTVQVPSNASFLVSGACRYAGAYMNVYGYNYDIRYNDATFSTLRGGLNTFTIESGYDMNVIRTVGGGGVRGLLITSSDILMQISAGSTWVSDIINSSGASDFLQVRQITFKDSGGNSVGTIVGNPGSISMTSNNLQFTDSNNSTTLSYIMSNLGGGGSGGGDIANVTQINIVDENGTLIGTIRGSTGSGLQISSVSSYPVSIRTGSTYQSSLFMSGGNMTLRTGGQSGQFIYISDAITNNKSASLGTYASASIMNYEAAIIGNQVLDFCNNIIVLINNILEQQGDQFPMPSALSATKQNSFGLKMSNIQANTQLGASRMNYIG